MAEFIKKNGFIKVDGELPTLEELISILDLRGAFIPLAPGKTDECKEKAITLYHLIRKVLPKPRFPVYIGPIPPDLLEFCDEMWTYHIASSLRDFDGFVTYEVYNPISAP